MPLTYVSASGLSIADPEFWRRPLTSRMADFAMLREQTPFVPVELENPFGPMDRFQAVIRHAELLEISTQPQTFCSGRGSISIQDMPAEAMEYFGSLITMDDPRHARLRRIVGRSFTPRRLEQVIDSVEGICTALIDEICEKGEVDLVEAISAPFPLLVICDMMGIPRSEFRTVLEATNVILGAGDPEMMGEGDPLGALFQAGITLTGVMNGLADQRRKAPTDDLTSALVHADVEGESLTAEELGAFFILLAVAGNDTTRTATSLGMHFLGEYPEQRRIWQADLSAVTPTAVEEIVRFASPVTFMRRTATGTRDHIEPRFRGRRQGRPLLRRCQSRSAGLQRSRTLRRSSGPESSRGLWRAGPALLPRSASGAPRVRRRLPATADPAARHRTHRTARLPPGHDHPACGRGQASARGVHAHGPTRP